ncbi:hypothetical protein ACFU51_16140 [Streptomyces sp. NPDC057430]|uniref:hypothetical protein n=1 Tax=Streptomyces sp. NPDC057430 TaxID=3346131 RepID=UPI0036D0DFF6
MSTPDDPDRTEEPLPRDPQNQQSAEGEDSLAIPVPDWPDSELPHTDVAGTARRDRVEDDDTGQEGEEGSAMDEPVD